MNAQLAYDGDFQFEPSAQCFAVSNILNYTPASSNALAPTINKFTANTPSENIYKKIIRSITMSLALNKALIEEEKATKANSATIDHFQRVMTLLPDELEASEPYVSEFGSICVDWDEDSSNLLSLVLQKDGMLSYVALLDGECVKGSEKFSGSRLPEGFLAAARRRARGIRAVSR